tara:strand:+ start:226 stop:438 length:213 start_codon:yes stop_codon:yes gene_type:complete
MSELKVKHKYKVIINWCNGDVEAKTVLAINTFQAKNKVISESKNKGLYDDETSTVDVVKYNVAVTRKPTQ